MVNRGRKNEGKKLSQNRNSRAIGLFLAFFLIFALFSFLFPPEEERIPLSRIVSEINSEKVSKIIVLENEIQVFDKNDQMEKAIREPDLGISESLLNLGADPEKLKTIELEFKEDGRISSWLFPILLSLLPPALILLLFWGIFRQAKIGTMQAFDFTKAKAKLFGAGSKQKEKTTFGDVAGLEEAKEELKEIIDFLKNPKKFFRMGAKIPRGVLLIGPPGCGKTLLARAVAFEAGVPFFSISGSEFIELFVGVGASRARNLFSQAKKAGKAIIFIDEIDSIGRSRGAGFGGGQDEREQTLNQILTEMDGFERNSEIIVMGATNKPESLDTALLRPGRFDRRIILDLPDIKDREGILKIHSRGKPLAGNVNLREVAERTPGFSGADLENLVNEAAILAARRNKSQIFQEEFLESIEKVLLGPERRSHVLTVKEKKIAAFHEAGHALVAASVSGVETVRKISIVARGLAAGYTLKMPKEEKRMRTRSEFLSELSTLFGGYVAEKIIFGEMTTGAANDLKKASQLARRLVKEYGMSSLGPITFGQGEKFAFLPESFPQEKNYSEEMAARIDREVAKIIKKGEQEAERILRQKGGTLKRLAKVLIEKETIEKQEFEKITGKK